MSEEKAKGTESSGDKGDNPSTGGKGKTDLHSITPENRDGKLNPSAPGNVGTTPGTTGEKK